jgi:hypothetical protein
MNQPAFTLQQLQQIHQVLLTAPLPLQMSLPLVQTAEAIMAYMQQPKLPPGQVEVPELAPVFPGCKP